MRHLERDFFVGWGRLRRQLLRAGLREAGAGVRRRRLLAPDRLGPVQSAQLLLLQMLDVQVARHH